MPKTEKLIAHLIPGVFILGILMTACQPAATPTAVEVPQTQLSQQLVVLEPNITSISQVSADGGQVVISGQTESVQPGSIIASKPTETAPYGLLKRVTTIQYENGQAILQTEDASLSDAIVQGSVNIHHAIMQGDIQFENAIEGVSIEYPKNAPKLAMPSNPASRSAKEGWVTINFQNTILFDKDGNHSTTNDQVRANGTYTLLPDVGLDLNFDGGKLANGKASLVVDQNLDLDIEVQVPKFTATVELANLKMLPFVVMVGGLPVVVNFEIPITVGLGYDSDDSVVLHFQNESNMNGGLDLVDQGQGWVPYANSNSTSSRSPFHFSSQSTVSFSAGIQFNVILYGLVGPKFEVKINFDADQDANTVCPQVYKQLLFEAGIKTVKLFDAFAIGTTFYKLELTPRELMESPAECSATVVPTNTPIPATVTPIPAVGSISGSVAPAYGGGTLPASARIFAHNIETGDFFWVDVVRGGSTYPFEFRDLPTGSYQIVAWFPNDEIPPIGLVVCSFFESNCEPSNTLKTITLSANQLIQDLMIVDSWSSFLDGDISAWKAEPLP